MNISTLSVILNITIGFLVTFLLPIGIILGVMSAVLNHKQSDARSKTKYKRYMLWGFFGPISLILIILALWGLTSAVRGFQEDNITNSTQAHSSTSLPTIDSVYPNIASIGDTLTIKGSNFTPLGGLVGNGWISNPHTFLRIKSSNDSAILWEGNEPDDIKSSVTDQIQVVIPSQVCRVPEALAGVCPAGGYMTLLPNQYTLEVDVDGRGNSNTIPLTIQVETL